MKKLFKGLIVGMAIFGMVSTAGAADLEMNLYGASAQHEFWNSAIPVWLDTVLNCDTVTTDITNQKHGISEGTLCDLTAQDADTITVRYSNKNSSYGIGTPCGMSNYAGDTCADGETEMCPSVGNCGTLACYPVHVGASDVELTSFTQSADKPNTFTYDFAKECPSFGNNSTEFLDANCDTILDGTAKSVVIPFGFFANNAISKHRCTAPAPVDADGTHMAYPKWGWQCDPTKTNVDGTNADCIPYYKCEDGVCNGGARAGLECAEDGDNPGPFGCPGTLETTQCEEMPIDNLSRLMVLQIFSADNEQWLDRWNQFGPWYPDAGIVRCMRCAGSGTHATFDLQVFRGDASLMPQSILGRFYHHASSSDLTKCVRDNGWPSSFGPTPWAGTEYDGDTRLAVGYADADKIFMDQDYKDVHIVKYQGVEPARAKIENNEYNFWAAQTLYWQKSVITTSGLDDLLNSLLGAAQDPTFVDSIQGRNQFWTTPGAMSGQKVPNERAYPTVVPGTAY